jgi:hypothetical protein
MNRPNHDAAADVIPPPDDDLFRVLAGPLERAFGRPLSGLDRRASPYASSAPLEEIDARLDDGRIVPLMFKDLSPAAAPPRARRMRPDFVQDPARSIEVYRAILPRAPAAPAVCYAAVEDPERGRYWLFLERVPGLKLQHVGELEAWEAAATWLAVFHARFAGERPPREAPRLLRMTREHCHRWIERALAFLDNDDGGLEPHGREILRAIAATYDRLIERLLSLPAGVLHGEFYAENVLIETHGEHLRVCPVDWEMAAWGPLALDLAALAGGAWGEKEKLRLAEAYRGAWAGSATPAPDALGDALAVARLYLAVRWLGWFGRRRPPPWQAHDWLGEASTMIEVVGL